MLRRLCLLGLIVATWLAILATLFWTLLQRKEESLRNDFNDTDYTISWRSFSSIAELKQSHKSLLSLADSDPRLFFLCFSLVYLFKQTFAVPGSALLNIAAGSIYPVKYAFPYVCLLTAWGSSLCYLLSYTIGSEASVIGVCDRVLPSKLTQLRSKLQKAQLKKNLLWLLISLRIFPFSPNWLLNLACPWLRVPLASFSLSVFLGLMPYNYITVQAGSALYTISSPKDLLNGSTVISLLGLTFIVLIPVLMKQSRHAKDK